MAENKTMPTDGAVAAFLDGIDHPTRKEDALHLNRLFSDITGWSPKLWGPSIVGFGTYHYVYDTGREGDYLATGFSPRKSNLSIYIMPGYAEFGPILDRLGKHKMGKSCLYINKLADVDLAVLEELIRAGLKDLVAKYPVTSG